MIDFSSLCDDHLYFAESTKILKRVFDGHDKIGGFAGLDSSGFGSDSGHFGGAGGCGVKREGVGDADIFMDVKEFPPEVVLRDPRTADIVSEDDGDVVGDGFFRTIYDSFENNVTIELLYLSCVGDGTVEQRIRQGRGQCRT